MMTEDGHHSLDQLHDTAVRIENDRDSRLFFGSGDGLDSVADTLVEVAQDRAEYCEWGRLKRLAYSTGHVAQHFLDALICIHGKTLARRREEPVESKRRRGLRQSTVSVAEQLSETLHLLFRFDAHQGYRKLAVSEVTGLFAGGGFPHQVKVFRRQVQGFVHKVGHLPFELVGFAFEGL